MHIEQSGSGYKDMTIWELAALHSAARYNRHCITCELIQAEVKKRTHKEQAMIGKLNYYAPVNQQLELI